MRKYISLDALVAEIKKRKKELIELSNNFENQWACASLDNILSFIKNLDEKTDAWSKEDESNLDSAIYYIRREPYLESNVEPIVDWLRNLKDRVQLK